MKFFYTLSLVFFINIFFACTNTKQILVFKALTDNEFNFGADSSFAIPHGKIWDERTRIHDSCMGSSFKANAVLMRTKDTIFPGTIVNMNTMKVVKNLDIQKLPRNIITFSTGSCYERRKIDVSFDSFMHNIFLFKIDSSNEAINTELTRAMQNALHTDIETNNWATVELTDGLSKVLDTTKDAGLLEYKEALLTPGNMVLIRSANIAEISFYFQTKTPISAALKQKLMTKPIISHQAYLKTEFFFINDNSFKLTLWGLFQILGQFMKCELN